MTTAPRTTTHPLEPVEVLRAGGAYERYELPFEVLFEWCRRTLGAETLDMITLHDGRVMLVDDAAYEKGLPPNAAATALYAALCRSDSAPVIAGDVVLVQE